MFDRWPGPADGPVIWPARFVPPVQWWGMDSVGILLCVSGILTELAAQYLLPERLERFGHLTSIFVIVVGVTLLVIDWAKERKPKL
jgi:hypothetical protein